MANTGVSANSSIKHIKISYSRTERPGEYRLPVKTKESGTRGMGEPVSGTRQQRRGRTSCLQLPLIQELLNNNKAWQGTVQAEGGLEV